VSDFEAHRGFLTGLAYRMLGSVAEAEDVVHDAYLRWAAREGEVIAEPRAYLARVVTNLCVDRLTSARARREAYVGTWLPEPVIEQDPAQPIAADLSVALLLTLERLSPLERAAFLLHDVFDMDYADVARTLERSEPACRQLAARAREHVRDERPRFEASEEASERLTRAFAAAVMAGEITELTSLLAEDAVLYSDGGGKRRAALNPIVGRDKILRFFVGVARKRGAPPPGGVRAVRINGLPGFLVVDPAEGPETIAFELAGDRIVAIYAVRNPDKLRHLS
jgi:RNA polymerase sigma-70 factor, ECF subfamily